ncbi:hypothetical protein QT972_09865 [Microcoleus sp. herbarium7]|uniref:hypothetical protein n=1 Tax=Microcoleus sp. herbarium7 TaxID=3055435 RepID=UPI002FD77290
MKIEVSGTEEECQAFLDVLEKRAIGSKVELAIDINIESPLPAPVPFVLIQGGKSTQISQRRVELPKLT